ncbi:hypothetical protein RJ639_043524 [Escallonia herrerae]|uniref:MHD domain-containing protein n=1 Tax=Escallonia herrerae TaxID=1293975 RepID=A0AA88W984_9ASTE|nr:hypothetical protein RJ639_043524 [Escallonia herrerae]
MDRHWIPQSLYKVDQANQFPPPVGYKLTRRHFVVVEKGDNKWVHWNSIARSYLTFIYTCFQVRTIVGRLLECRNPSREGRRQGIFFRKLHNVFFGHLVPLLIRGEPSVFIKFVLSFILNFPKSISTGKRSVGWRSRVELVDGDEELLEGVEDIEVMLEKQFNGHWVDRKICAWFWEQSIAQGDSFKLLPVIASPTHYLFQIVREGITFLACTQVEMPPLMGIELLAEHLIKVADVLSDYFGGLNEDLIKDNFVIVYELLDEMIDNGFPLTTEPNILREMIAPPNIVSKMLSVVTGNSSNMSNTLPVATASCVPWRTTDVKHANNEVYVDLVEEMDAIVNRHFGNPREYNVNCRNSFDILLLELHLLEALRRDGILVKCEIYGEVQMNSHLSGLPDLTLSFANPSILNDVRFHPCVRFRPWESHQILSFVPPDGQFKLMSYRVKKLKNTPIYVKPQLSSDSGTCRINVLVGLRNDPGKTIDSITVQFPLPPCILSADLSSNHGTVNILANKTCCWSIGGIPKDKSPSLCGTLMLESGLERLHVSPTFQVGFRIMSVALSGLQIDKLDLKNLPARPYKGFRALTRSGEYEVRS